MKIGVLINLDTNDFENKFKQVHDFGLSSCQLCCWNHELMTEQNAEKVKEYRKKYDVEISTFWCGWSGPSIWNFYDGPITLGLVPAAYRFKRVEELKHGSDFAKMIEVENIATHAGFMPENPVSTEYSETIAALKNVAEYAKKNGQYFLFETGQETPVTLRRAIEDIGTGNLGINLDPANLICYGKANPVDALDVFGEYVRDVHAKDACYPTDGHNLGEEKPLGQGKVNFPKFIARLKEISYDGPLTIEREIEGEQQIKDIRLAVELLGGLI